MEIQQPSHVGGPADPSYRHRRELAYARVEALGLKRRWIARRIGRSVRCVTEVLRGTDTGAPTLALVEILLRQVESGEIALPREAIVQKRASEEQGGQR